MHAWLNETLGRISGRSALAQAIRYALNHWEGLILFLDDGRLELDTNTVERAIRPVTLCRKNALFAGSDEGALYCPSGYFLTDQEHFGAYFQALAAGSAGSQPRAVPPVTTGRRVGGSMARFHRTAVLAGCHC
jgi:hypothetical protein